MNLDSILTFGAYGGEDWYTTSTASHGSAGHPTGEITSLGDNKYKITVDFTESDAVDWRSVHLGFTGHFQDGSHYSISTEVPQYPYIYLRVYSDGSCPYYYWEDRGVPISCDGKTSGWKSDEEEFGGIKVTLSCNRYDNELNSP
jgi:hypothetical protein